MRFRYSARVAVAAVVAAAVVVVVVGGSSSHVDVDVAVDDIVVAPPPVIEIVFVFEIELELVDVVADDTAYLPLFHSKKIEIRMEVWYLDGPMMMRSRGYFDPDVGIFV